MVSRSRSGSSHPLRRPTLPDRGISRRQSSFGAAEQGLNGAHPASAEQQEVIEEIEEIKRYEDFTTIDWVQDAAREQSRRERKQKDDAGFFERGGRLGWRHKLWESYDAGQAWIVVTLVGAAIGLNAGFLNIVTEWLSDVKLGYCETAFYLNENFCCWGAENGRFQIVLLWKKLTSLGCPEWHRWSSIWPVNYFLYFLFSVLILLIVIFLQSLTFRQTIFALTSASLVKSFAPYAAGSGISEIKCIIAGFVMKGFLGFWTLLIKSISLPLAIASGLSVGKEGPSVHYAVCTGNVISKFFEKYKRNAAKTREILSACAAAGVAVAFGSPIGGVLFSLEVNLLAQWRHGSSILMCVGNVFVLPSKDYVAELFLCFGSNCRTRCQYRIYFRDSTSSSIADAEFQAMNPFRTGQLVMFQVRYDRSWHFFEIIFFVFIGIFGGLYGAFVIKWNLRAQAFRKRYLTKYAVLEATLLAAGTAILCYPNMFLRIDMTESMEILFLECEGAHDYNGLCE